MSLKHGILGLLNYGSMTGYELDKTFKDSLSFFWQAQTSQIYRELDAMEKKNWLESERIIQNEKPNKRVYTITTDGKKEFKRWLRSPDEDIEAAMRIKSAFLMHVFFAGEMDKEHALSMLRNYRDKCRAHNLELDAVGNLIPQYSKIVNNNKRTKYWEIAALYGEISYRAALEWAERAIAMLEEEKE